MFKCNICNNYYKFINGNHLKTHNITTKEYRRRYPNAKLGYSQIQKRKEKRFLEKYGVRNPGQLPEIQIKMRKTCKKNLGVEVSSQSSIVLDKMKRTMLKKYGVENPSQSIKVIIKKKLNWLKKHSFLLIVEDIKVHKETGEYLVHCKNHLCPNSKEKGGWFTPTNVQLAERVRALETKTGSDGCYFYCSDKCKDECPLYNLQHDPNRNIEKIYTQQEYETFRKFVLERDDYKCQYCDEKATHIHHERPQKLEPFFALDPDFAWSCCKECHYKYGHKTGTECSTGNLANKICI